MIKLILLLLSFPIYPPTHGSLCTIKDPDFIEYRYEEQIPYCERNVSTYRKNKICRRDGVWDRTDFTVDHIIPLALGGSNHDDNLWCQHKSLAVTKLEKQTYWYVREGEMTQKEGIRVVLKAKFSPRKTIGKKEGAKSP